MEFNHLSMRVHCRILINIFQDLSFCCPIIQTILKIGRANQPTSLPFSHYLYSQSSYFQGATHSDLSNYCLGQLISDCTNRSSSTFLSCFLQLFGLPPVSILVSPFLQRRLSFIHVVCSLYSVLYNYFVDIADSNQLPLREPFGFTLHPTSVFYLRASRPVCCPIYTNIIFRTKLSSRKSANKLDFLFRTPIAS